MSLSDIMRKCSISSVFRAYVMILTHRQEDFVNAAAFWGHLGGQNAVVLI